MKKSKVLVIVGPTASGKTSLGVELARQFNGEVISADSRQVYRGLNIGTGKVTKCEMRGVPHHLLDVASPKKVFTAHDFATQARRAIADITKRGKLPIIVGGTGFYIDAALGRVSLADTPTNPELRASLKDKTAAELYAELQKTDPSRAESMNTPSERNNHARLVRAVEIAHAMGESPLPATNELYDTLWIGLEWPREELSKRIEMRLDARLHIGMIAEAKRLHAAGLSYKRMEELGLEYGALARFLKGETTRTEMRTRLLSDIVHYAKRQETYWKRNKDIDWYELQDASRINDSVQDWLSKDVASIATMKKQAGQARRGTAVFVPSTKP